MAGNVLTEEEKQILRESLAEMDKAHVFKDNMVYVVTCPHCDSNLPSGMDNPCGNELICSECGNEIVCDDAYDE